MFLQKLEPIRMFQTIIMLKACELKKKESLNGYVYLSKKSQALLLRTAMSTNCL